MSRYIDADAFLKEYCEPYPHVYMAMSKAVADAPSIDIVRCSECKHWVGNISEDDGIYEDECKWITEEAPNADDFCSYGERSD